MLSLLLGLEASPRLHRSLLVSSLPSIQCAGIAATWVWDSLWSTRRHVSMDILDVAILEQGSEEACPAPSIARWLFTSKDGKVLKKGSKTANFAALKQAFRARVLRGAPHRNTPFEGSSGDNSTGQPFATALLRDGTCTHVNEDTWQILFPDTGHDLRVAAIISLEPGNPSESGRARGQRLACQYRLRLDDSPTPAKDGTTSRVSQDIVSTFMVVSSRLARNRKRYNGKAETHVAKDGGLGRTCGEKLVASRVNSANHEAEHKLRRIVRCVERAKRVRVLRMTAMFVTVPSERHGVPGVWLERVVGLSVTQLANTERAPLAGQPSPTAMRNTCQNVDTDTRPRESAQGGPRLELPPERSTTQTVKRGQTCEGKDTALEVLEESHEIKTGSTAHQDAMGGELVSTATDHHQIVSTSDGRTARETPPEPAESPPSAPFDVDHQGSDVGDDTEGSPALEITPPQQQHPPTRGGHRRTPPARRCAGDFCSYRTASRETHPRHGCAQADVTHGDTGDFDWTHVDVCCERGKGLLRVDPERAFFPVRLKSLALARVEATANHRSHWDGPLIESWSKAACEASDADELACSGTGTEVGACSRLTEYLQTHPHRSGCIRLLTGGPARTTCSGEFGYLTRECQRCVPAFTRAALSAAPRWRGIAS